MNIAVCLLAEARRDSFDRALLVSSDSDFSPAVVQVKEEFPEKDFRILCPPGREASWELYKAAGGKRCSRNIGRIHIERNLLPEEVGLERAGDLLSAPIRPAGNEGPK